jgi:hypothetical protein
VYCRSRLGRVLQARSAHEEAEPVLRAALEGFRTIWPVTHWSIAYAQSDLGATLMALGEFEDAEPLLVAGYEGIRKKRGPGHPQTRETLERLVQFYEAIGDEERAADYLAEAGTRSKLSISESAAYDPAP